MAANTIIEVPHNLSRLEVRHRMASRVGDLHRHIPGGVAQVTSHWPSEDRMAIDVLLMGQAIAATLDIEERLVRISLVLPPMLSVMSGPISAIIRRSGEDLLLNDHTDR